MVFGLFFFFFFKGQACQHSLKGSSSYNLKLNRVDWKHGQHLTADMSEDFHMRSQMRTGEDMVRFAKNIKASLVGDMIHNCEAVVNSLGNANSQIW